MSINAVISIKTPLWHLVFIICIISQYYHSFPLTCIILIICFCIFYVNYSFKITLNHLFLFNYITCIMSFNLYYVNHFHDNRIQLFHSNLNNWYNSTTSPCHTPCRAVFSTLLAFITYCWTIPMPTSWQTTSCIRPRNPASDRRALQERDCAGSAEWLRCSWLELPAAFHTQLCLVWPTSDQAPNYWTEEMSLTLGWFMQVQCPEESIYSIILVKQL